MSDGGGLRKESHEALLGVLHAHFVILDQYYIGNEDNLERPHIPETGRI